MNTSKEFMNTLRKVLSDYVSLQEDIEFKEKRHLVTFIKEEASNFQLITMFMRGAIPSEKINHEKENKLIKEMKELYNDKKFNKIVPSVIVEEIIQDFQRVDDTGRFKDYPNDKIWKDLSENWKKTYESENLFKIYENLTEGVIGKAAGMLIKNPGKVALAVGALWAYHRVKIRNAAKRIMAEGREQCQHLRRGIGNSEYKECMIAARVRAVDQAIQETKQLLQQCSSNPSNTPQDCQKYYNSEMSKLLKEKRFIGGMSAGQVRKGLVPGSSML